VREGWDKTTLGRIATLNYGRPLREADRAMGKVPVVGSAGGFAFHDCGNALTRGGTIVVGRKGTAGSVTWIDGPAWVTDTAYWAEPVDSRVTLRFLYLLLEGSDLPSVCAQTGVPGLNRDRAYEIPAQLPPLPEQRRIVDLVGALDDAIAAAEQSSLSVGEAQRHLPAATLVKGVSEGWESSRLNVALGGDRAIRTGPFGSQLHQKDYVSGGPVAVVMPTDMRDGRVQLSGAARIERSDADRLARHITQVGDVLWSRRGDVTRFAVIDEVSAGSLCGTGCFLIRPADAADTKWLEVLLSAPETGQWLVDHAVGATMANLNRSILGAIPVMIPPVDQREALAAGWVALRATARGLDQTIADLRILRANLLTALLSGEHELPESYDEFIEEAS
jgi:type I restriction enzyme S subunit